MKIEPGRQGLCKLRLHHNMSNLLANRRHLDLALRVDAKFVRAGDKCALTIDQNDAVELQESS